MSGIRKKYIKFLTDLTTFPERRAIRLAFSAVGMKEPTGIATHTTLTELRMLYRLATQCPTNSKVVEIGSYLGASTCYLAAGLTQSEGSLICVDTWQNETMPEGSVDTYAQFNRNTSAFRNRIITIRKKSALISPADLPNQVSLSFIDGDHGYDTVKNDFYLLAGLTAANGKIVFHDHLFFKGVARVLGEALSSGEWIIEGLVHNLIWIRRRYS